MKSLFNFLFVISFTGFYIGCNNPQPTALVSDEDALQIEVINNNPSEPTSLGIDSSGLGESISRFTNVVAVTGSKTTYQGTSFKSSFAQAVFFDRSKPVYDLNNKLIGFKTRTPGTIFFNNRKAQLKELRIRYGANRDTTLGLRYVLHRRGNFGDPFDFDFNSVISFTFIPDSAVLNTISFDIHTPPEIFLTVKTTGRKADRNLNLILEWNASYINNFEILLSIFDAQKNLIPLYKIKTADDGKFIMPKNLLEELSLRYDSIIYTVTRKYQWEYLKNSSELFVISQSINTISADIP